MLGIICHRCTCGLHARMQHASLVIPSLLSSAARTDAACLARDAIAIITFGCTHGCSMLGIRCRRHACRLHAWMQHAWHGKPSLYLWAARTDAACFAPNAIATFKGSKAGAACLAGMPSLYSCAARKDAANESPSLISSAARADFSVLVARDAIATILGCTHDAACLARDAIGTTLGCTHRCNMLGTRCHCPIFGCTHGCSILGQDAIADHGRYARMRQAWHELPSLRCWAAR